MDGTEASACHSRGSKEGNVGLPPEPETRVVEPGMGRRAVEPGMSGRASDATGPSGAVKLMG